MNRYIIYNPETQSYVKIHRGSWNSGYSAPEVNSYSSIKSARRAIKLFESLRHCKIIQVEKTVKIISEVT